jgi:hypothetical protein
MAAGESFTREERLAMRDLLAHAEGLLMVAMEVGMVQATDDEQRAVAAPIAKRLAERPPAPPAAPASGGGDAPREDQGPPLSEEEYLALWPSLMHDLLTLRELRRRGMLHSHNPGQQAVLRDIDRLLESVRSEE